MAATKIIIAGGGIAGPVLGMLLKLKGYDPTIYERLEAPSDMGLSLAYVYVCCCPAHLSSITYCSSHDSCNRVLTTIALFCTVSNPTD